MAVGATILFSLFSLVILTVVFFPHAKSMCPLLRTPSRLSVWWLLLTPS